MAQHRHKRETNARKIPRAALVAAPVAVLATLSAVTLGITSPGPDNAADLTAATPPAVAEPFDLSEREQTVSRSAVDRRAAAKEAKAERRAELKAEERAERKAARAAREKAERRAAAATAKAVKGADIRLWATADLNVWDASGASAVNVDLIEEGTRVLATGRKADGRTEIVLAKQSRWVSSEYLADSKPKPEPEAKTATAEAGVGGTCSNGTSVPSGVSASIVKVHQAVCARWPEVTSFGTLRADGEHAQGRAIDIMVSGDKGWEIANYLRENASALGVEYAIYAQHIWSVERGGEGWRGMSNRGSATANHYDHVHVTVW